MNHYLFMCTQNQFSVQLFMKPVFSTDVHTDYIGVEPKQLHQNSCLIWNKKTTFNDKIDEKWLFPQSLVPPSVWSGGHLIIDRLFDFFFKTLILVKYSYARSPGSQQTESELKKVINIIQLFHSRGRSLLHFCTSAVPSSLRQTSATSCHLPSDSDWP